MPPSAVIARLRNTAMSMGREEQQDPLATPRQCTGGGSRGRGHANFYGSGLVDALAAGQR
jgi:hypothetical protein